MPRLTFIALLVLRCAAPQPPPPACEKGALGFEARAQEGKGIVVAEILAGGPADRAGIQRDDVLVSVGGVEARFACQVPALTFNRDCLPVAVVVRRDGAKIEKAIAPVDQRPLYDKACASGDAAACFRAAWFAGKLDDPKMLERACDRWVGPACTYLAYLYVSGKVVAKDEIRSLDFYTRGCTYGDAHGCYNVGVMYGNARGTSPSSTRAAKAYEQACAEGVAMACTNLGYLYERGLGTMRDPVRAVEMFRRGCEGSACEGSNLRGCVNLGDAYRDGIGVAKDPARAAEIFREACERKVAEDDETTRIHACVLLGALEINGVGVPEDVESGLARSNEGCARGDAFGCFNVAVLHANREDYVRAAEFFEKACNGNDGEACFELALLYDEAKGVAFDPARSDALFRRACAAGYAPACSR